MDTEIFIQLDQTIFVYYDKVIEFHQILGIHCSKAIRIMERPSGSIKSLVQAFIQLKILSPTIDYTSNE